MVWVKNITFQNVKHMFQKMISPTCMFLWSTDLQNYDITKTCFGQLQEIYMNRNTMHGNSVFQPTSTVLCWSLVFECQPVKFRLAAQVRLWFTPMTSVCLKRKLCCTAQNRNLRLQKSCMTAPLVTKQGKYSLNTSDKTSAAN